MEKPKIVAVLIVKNEEVMLPRCLDSVKGVDNIYIVDTGSTDKTVEIAKKYTENVFEDFTWCDDFAKARNHALNKVQEENAYILSIDADEHLHDFTKLRESVNRAAEEGKKVLDCKLISAKDGQEHFFPRCFKKDPEVFWAGAIHNHISMKADFNSTIEITYDYSPAHNGDPNRAFRILKKVNEDPNVSPRDIFYLGREYWYRSMFKDAYDTLLKYIPVAHFMAEKADAFLLASRSAQAMGMWEEARHLCMEAIIINPHFKEAVLFMSVLAGRGSGNPIWEKNGIWWDRAAEASDNSSVLFVRK